MRLLDRVAYLRVRRHPTPDTHDEVAWFDDFDSAVADWTDTSRVSPLVPIEGTTIPVLTEIDRSWFLFAGPVFPGGLPTSLLDRPHSMWLSFGMHNVVQFFCDKRELGRALEEILEQAGEDTPWEIWRLERSRIVNTRASAAPQVKWRRGQFGRRTRSLVGVDLALCREYEGHIRTAIAAATRFDPRLRNDLQAFDSAFRETLALNNIDRLSKIGLVGNASAVLLRHISQTYSGTQPVLEWPCTIAQHSLLGIGIPGMALASLRRFFENKAYAYSPVTKLQALKKIPVSRDLKPAPNLRTDQPFWEIIDQAGRPKRRTRIGSSGSHGLPLLTCFSTRDGFRSTITSLSAPLEVVESGNTRPWTPMIVTHELSHALVDSVLIDLLPTRDSASALKQATSLWKGETQPRNGREWVLQLLLEGVVCYAGRRGSVPDSTSLGDILFRYWGQIDEILTDCFDYLCFYRGNERRFVQTIWTSLSVFPHIASRVPQYVLRTLCALHTLHVSQRDGCAHSTDKLRGLLRELRDDDRARGRNGYAEQAVDEMQAGGYEARLGGCTDLVKFARLVLAPASIVSHFGHEEHTARSRRQAAGGRGGYALKPLVFSGELPDNLLRFVESYSEDDEPSPARTLWLWQHLAF
jgi:hypothetical protein